MDGAKVDEAREVVPAYVNPRKSAASSHTAGGSTSGSSHAAEMAFSHIDPNRTWIFSAETGKEPPPSCGSSVSAGMARCYGAQDDGMRLRFATTLYLFKLAALNAGRRREMALCALAVCPMPSARWIGV
ncbi:MAG: hypothetical protein ACLS7Z_00415 [Christensenellales bacterium]